MNKQLDNLLIKVKSRLYEKIPTWWAKQYRGYKTTYHRVKFNLFLSVMAISGAIYGINFSHLNYGAQVFAVYVGGAYFLVSLMIFILCKSLFNQEKKFENLVRKQIQLNDIDAYEFCENFMSHYLNNNSSNKTNGELHGFDTSLEKEELQDLMSIAFNKAQLEALAHQIKYNGSVTFNDLCRIQNIKEKEYMIEEYENIFNDFAQKNNFNHIKQEYEEESSYKKYL